MRARGQAVVEMVLGLIVFVTILIVGIHFAEVGYLSIRVQEAATAPLWDATAFRVHTMRNDAAPAQVGDFTAFDDIPATIEREAQARFVDFDGRRSQNRAPTIRQVFTQLDQLQLFCRRNDTVFFDLPRGGGPGLRDPRAGGGGFAVGRPGTAGVRGAEHSVLGRVYENVGGVSCGAGARLTAFDLPRNFLEGAGGFFSVPQYQGLTMRVCSSGRAVSGTCPGRYALLLGDWGFTGVNERGHCPLQPDRPDQPCDENRAFYNAARYVFEDNDAWSGREANDFALQFAGADPLAAQGFFMSYRGWEDGYVEEDTPPGEAEELPYRPFNTGGVSDRPRATRGTCFLGRTGC